MQFSRDPPPYPGHSKQIYNQQPGFRESYSGSETSTDVSMSSSENLSLLLRQDPQGEETKQAINSPVEYVKLDSNSILARLGMPAVEVKSTNPGTFYVTGSMPNTSVSYHTASPYVLNLQNTQPHYGLQTSQALPTYAKDTNLNSAHVQHSAMDSAYLSELPSPDRLYMESMYSSNYLPDYATIPDFSNLPPPPEYPGVKKLQVENSNGGLRRSYEMIEKSTSPTCQTRSQPDLTQYRECKNASQKKNGIEKDENLSNKKNASGTDHPAIATKAAQMVELISEENRKLRAERDTFYKKISKLQRFEMELQKVHESHQDLLRSSQKREKLEKAMRDKLEAEIKRLQESNKELKDQLHTALSSSNPSAKDNNSTDSKEDNLRKEMAKKDAVIAKLIAQNKDLVASKENSDQALAVHQSTLQEQRTHIDFLDKALMNAQANIIRLEEECRKKQVCTNKVDQLHRSLASLKLSGRNSPLPDAMKLNNCTQSPKQSPLNKRRQDIDNLSFKSQTSFESNSSKKSNNSEINVSSEDLKRRLSEKDDTIEQLENEILKWQAQCLEDGAMCQLAVDAASLPREARIAALERSSAESGRIIAEQRTEKLKHLEEVYQANKQTAELETQIKTLQARLVEKDALIQVLERHSYSHSNSNISLLCSLQQSPRSSFNTGTLPAGIISNHHHHSDNNVSTTTNSGTDDSLSKFHAKSHSTTVADDKEEKSSPNNVSLQQTLLQKRLDAKKDKLSSQLWQV